MRIGPSDGGETLLLYTDVTAAREAAAELAARDAQLDGRAADLELLQAALAIAGEAGSFEAAARRINERVCRWAGWPVGHAWRAADGGAALAPCPEALVTDGDGFEPLRAALAAERPARGEGLAGRVLQAGRVVWVANAESDPTFPAERRASMPGIRGACGVPVRRGEQVVAVLEFLAREQLVPGEGGGAPARERRPGAGVGGRAGRLTPGGRRRAPDGRRAARGLNSRRRAGRPRGRGRSRTRP